jgi:hypothetical protein
MIPVGGGSDRERRCENEYGVKFVQMYANAKIITIKTIPGIGERGDEGEQQRG